MSKSSRYIAAACACVLCPVCLPGGLGAQDIHVRTASQERTVILRKMVERLAQREPELASRVNVDLSAPGFLYFADGGCHILAIDRFPDRADLKALSWGVPGKVWDMEHLAGQQRVFVIAHKANPIAEMSFEQIRKVLVSSDKAATWEDIGSAGGRIRVYLEPAKSRSVNTVRYRSLRRVSGGAVRIARIRDGVEYCADDKAVVEKVRRDRNGIGFVADGGVSLANVKVLAVAGPAGGAVAPTPGPVLQKQYPLSDWLLLYLHPKAPQGAKELCEQLCGPAVSDIAAEEGFTTQTAIERAKAAIRRETARAGKAEPVRLAGMSAYSGFASDIATEFTVTKSAVRADSVATFSDRAAIARFLAGGDMVLLDNPPDEEAMRVFGQAWEDAMPVPFMHGARVVAVIVNSTNKLEALTVGQVKAIFSEEVSDWAVIGSTGLTTGGSTGLTTGGSTGAGASGIRINAFGLWGTGAVAGVFHRECLPVGQFKRVVLKKDTAAVVAAVSMDPRAIAFVDLAAMGDSGGSVKVLAMRVGMGSRAKVVHPTAETIKSAMYPLSQRCYLYVHPKASDTAKDFAKFIATCGGSEASPYADTVKAVMDTYRKHGLIPLADAAITRVAKDAADAAEKAAAEADKRKGKGKARK